ncbi:MAG: hypothetical protein A2Y15_08005 [Clostridiales bacterium GWF2_36_10]|nr:MAG: hypothetical protein A2Y15_08005 [Clostridiales bacterium GWF2_36_10]HAN20371.1 hypothetical protein [Clostridiales bacterium]
MKTKKYISLLLSILLVFSAFAAFPLGADASETSISNLSTYKQYFRRTMGSFARADMYKTDILASLTISQSMLESGWGESNFGTIGKNLFCIKAYSSWTGMVFDNKENIVYSNLNDYRIISGSNFTGSSWRAYASWDDSIIDHSTLLNSSQYVGIPGMLDYKEACYAVVTRGYTSDYQYSERLISLIENYDLAQFDNIKANEDGVNAMEMSDAEKVIGLGGTAKLSAEIITETTVTKAPVWASANETVATVSQDGTVAAKASGYTLITATIGNREACCIVTVSNSSSQYDATVTENLNVRAEPNATATIKGKFLKGQGINIAGELQNGWYPVSGLGESGSIITGFSSAAYISLISDYEEVEVTKVGISRFELNRDVNTTYQLKAAVGSAFAIDKTLTWTSSDPTIVSVTNDGLVTTRKYGTATISVTAVNGIKASCIVNVTTEQVRYNAVTTASLYVRNDDNASAKALGILASGRMITVTDNYINSGGLIDDAWHYVEGTMNDNTTGKGYSKSDYIVLLSRAGEESFQTNFEFVGTAVTITDGYLYGIIPTSTVGDLLGYVANENAFVYNKNGNLMSNEDMVSTGCKIKLVANNLVTNSASIVIRGDINGNGTIDSTDYLFVKRIFLGTAAVEDAYLKAALVSSGSNISVTDYIMIKRHYLGTFDIAQNPQVN